MGFGELGLVFGTLGAFLVPMLAVSFFLPVVIYLVVRWRTYREGLPGDPHLGFKTALAFFQTTAYQVALLGVFLFVYGLLTKGGDNTRGDLIRTAFGLLVPSLLVYFAHMVAMSRTNAVQLPLVPRMFAGLSLVHTGVIGFFGLDLAFVSLLSRGESGEAGRIAWSLVIVYTVAWVVQGLRFLRSATSGGPPPGLPLFDLGGLGGGAGGLAMPPPAVPPPGAMPVPPPAVPPPGSGGYPPAR
jgi:hypothetical protein